MSVYDEMVATLTRELSESGVSIDQAATVSNKVLCELSVDLGGRFVYLPKRFSIFCRKARDIKIREDFNGRNLETVCKKYQVSKATVYRACRR